MPELAEVYFNAGKWKRFVGERFTLSHLNQSARCCREFEKERGFAAFRNLELISGYTHGKRMLFVFGNEFFLSVHLGMTGSLEVESIDFKGLKHDHLVLKGESVSLVFRDPRQFGKVSWEQSSELPDWWTSLPPEPHDSRFSHERFSKLCDRRPKSVLKAFLLDQDCFPGVGNWMADEILWQARVRPGRRVGSLNEGERKELFERCRLVCREALDTIGVDYRDPPKSWLFRHRWKDGGKCPKSGEDLVREQIGGRTTCWSPSWQR